MADAPGSLMECLCVRHYNFAARRNSLARNLNFGEDKCVFIDMIFNPCAARLFMPCKLKVTS